MLHIYDDVGNVAYVVAGELRPLANDRLKVKVGSIGTVVDGVEVVGVAGVDRGAVVTLVAIAGSYALTVADPASATLARNAARIAAKNLSHLGHHHR